MSFSLNRPRAGPRTTVLQSLAVSMVGPLPAFLVGALAVQLRSDLHIGLAGLGLATAFLFGVSSLIARLSGGVVQRIGSRRGVVLAASFSAVALVGAGTAQNYLALVAALLFGGLGNALAQPAANLGLSQFAPERRLGLTFGIKQASVPAATFFGGMAVPGIALVVGWRWVWAVAASMALAIACWAALTTRNEAAADHDDDDQLDKGLPLRGLVVLTVGGGMATAAATTVGVFLVDSGVQAGLQPGHAGLVFAMASLLGLTARIGLGWAADHYLGRSLYILIANLLVVGALGYVLLSLGNPTAFMVGACLAYGAGWAWTGVFHFAIVKDNRRAAASATGFVQTGLSLGAACGPLGFGLLAGATSYQAAWLATAGLSLLAALVIRSGRRTVRRSRGLAVARVGQRLRPRAHLGKH